jgi:hypothetical protein
LRIYCAVLQWLLVEIKCKRTIKKRFVFIRFQVCQLLNSVLDIQPVATPDVRGQSSFADFSPMSIASSFDDETDLTSKHLSTSSTSSSTSNNRKRKIASSCEELNINKRQQTELVSMETLGNFYSGNQLLFKFFLFLDC